MFAVAETPCSRRHVQGVLLESNASLLHQVREAPPRAQIRRGPALDMAAPPGTEQEGPMLGLLLRNKLAGAAGVERVGAEGSYHMQPLHAGAEIERV